jgi:hypothetical protein
MQIRRLFVCEIAIVFECGPNRIEVLIVELAHLFGQKLRLAFARDLLRHRARADHFLQQVFR